MKVNFTKKFLTKCQVPAKGRTYFHDTQEKGLSAYITSNGILTFFVRKRIGGKDERSHLGHFPEGIKKFKEKSRQRFLRKDEIPRFFKALTEESNDTIRDYIILSLLTGARKSNVREEVNFSLSEWHIKETKNGESHVIPLTGPAIEILQERKGRSQSPFVFPGNGKKGHLVDPKKSWKRILKQADIVDLRIHDLRRTLGSWMGAVGATTAIIGKTLAHKSVEATRVYERIDIDPVREFITLANDAIFKAAYGEKKYAGS